MPKYVRLSYNIKEDAPLYPGIAPVMIRRNKAITKGDGCNTYFVAFSNHAGTHVDAPAHFFEGARSISEYRPDELIFRKPVIVDCPKGASGIVEVGDLEPSLKSKEFDMVLIRTGFCKNREKDTRSYCRENPCISPESARYLRNNFPRLRALGVDCISAASRAHRELGRETHRILLTEGKSPPILIIEDLYLSEEVERLDEVIVSPLFIEGVDSAPCTVTGVLYD